MTADLPIARREQIASRLHAGHAVSSASLAAEFSISEDAIRRDLRALAAQGRCRRVYGGALPTMPAAVPLTARVNQDRDRKDRLAQFAASAVRPGEFIFLDSGSTNLAVVEYLPDDAGLTVATNSIPIAAAVVARQDIRLIVIGGDVDLIVGGCVDSSAIQSIARMTFDRTFLGVCAVSVAGGVSVHDFGDSVFKRALLAQSRQAFVLVTTEKLGMTTRHQVANLDQVEAIVIEPDAPEPEILPLIAEGANILRAIET